MVFSETDMVEFKREYSRSVLKAVVAFANTHGGMVLIGIEDDGTVCGVEDPEGVMLAVTNAIRDAVKPNAAMIAECEQLEVRGKTVVGIRVERGVDRPYYLADKGMRPEGVYVRQGAASYMASEAEIRTLLRESRDGAYESGRCLQQDLTFGGTRAFFEKEGLELGDAQMRSLGMVDGDGQFTNLAWMLSDQCTAVVKLACFFGTNRTTFKDRLEVSGSVLVQFERSLDFLAKHMGYKTQFVNMRRVDYEDFPPDAVREALINAIVHRDYESQVATLISVLEDRLEFTSYGGLPTACSLGDFQLDVSVPRNPKLAAVFYRLRLIEAYGTGIRRMFEAYEGSGKTPVFDITRSFFRVRLPNRNYEGSDELGGESRLDVVAASAGMGAAGGAGSAGKELLNQERVVLAMLEEQGPLKRSEIQERFTFSQATLLRVIKRLESKGLVQAEGNTRRRVYRATGKALSAGT